MMQTNPDIDFIKRDGKRISEESSTFPLEQLGLMCASFLVGVPVALAAGVINLPRKILFGKESKVVGTKHKLQFPPVSPCMVSDLKPLQEREFDIVLYGATGFTGGLAAKYVAKQYGSEVKWAIAGRRVDALEKLREELINENPGLKTLSIISVDSGNEQKLQEMCARTRVVCTTVGPFQLYGTPLVRACISTGTSCCDITGELDWHSGLIENYDEDARKAGSKIVSFCGHDCVPWDLSTFVLATELKKKGEELVSIHHSDEVNSAPSGGTIATVLESIPPKPYIPRRLNFSPLLMEQNGEKSSCEMTDKSTLLPNFGPTQQWGGPFVMAMVNAKVVERSNALNHYGKSVEYRETRTAPSLGVVLGRYFQLAALGPVLVLPETLSSRILPQPGQGPSVKKMDEGFLQVTAIATGSKSTKIGLRLYFPTDPGYRDTARMLVECGLSIALSPERCLRSGVLTPGSCCPQVHLERLLATGTEISFISKI